jgi:hypothetical protein
MDDDEVRKDIALIRSACKRYPQIHPIPAHDASAFRTISVFPLQFEFTRINTTPTFPCKKIEDLRETRPSVSVPS